MPLSLLLSEMYVATASIRWSMLCIWYLFLWIASFNSLESSAIFTLLSFFTVITTGLMKHSSEHFSRRFICLSSIKFSSSFSTRSNRCSGTLLPLCCVGLKFSLNVDFAMWFFDLPSLVHRCGYFFEYPFNYVLFYGGVWN